MASASSKRATLADVARAAGTSLTTASHALSHKGSVAPATRQAVQQAAIELNFQADPVAQRLSKGLSHDLVGMFVSGLYRGTSLEKVLLIQRLLQESGLEAPLYSCGVSGTDAARVELEAMRRLRRQKPRAIVAFTMHHLAGESSERNAVLTELQSFGDEGGIVTCYDHQVDLECDQVIFDRADNTAQAARHLLTLGHRSVGFYDAGETHPAAAQVNSRRQGFERAMKAHGAVVQPAWMWEGAGDEGGGTRLAEKFLKLKNRPTALCVVNESAAWAFMNEVMQAGIEVPRDLSVVSHDDLPIARYTRPTLTTVSQPIETIAQGVVELLLSRLQGGRSEGRRVVVRGQLVRRQSAIEH